LFIELSLIFALTLLSEFLSKALSLPIPGALLGLLILFMCLHFKIIKLKSIENVSKLFLANMAILFVHPGVNLLSSLEHLKGVWLKVIIVVVITTMITMAITGKVVDFLIERSKNGNI